MLTVLDEAKRLYKLGFAILWLHKKSKRPLESGWTTGPRKPWAYLASTYKTGYNIGVRTGTPSKIGGLYLACIDVDVKDAKFKIEALNALKKLVGDDRKLPEVRSGSGNGSRHLYCLTAKPFKMLTIVKQKDCFEICVYSDGRQMALPPSIHPDTGKAYLWKSPVVGGVIPDMTECLQVYTNVNYEELNGGNGHAPHTVTERSEVAEGRALFNFKAIPVDVEWLPISEKVMKGITDGFGIGDRSSFLLPAATALRSAGLSRDETLSVLTDPTLFISGCSYDHAQTKDRRKAAEWLWRYSVRKVFEERSAESVFKKVVPQELLDKKLTPEQVEAQTNEILSEISWDQNLDYNGRGKIANTLKNLDLILSNAVGDDGNVFVKDLFANRVIYGTNTPWKGVENEALQDIDLILIKRWLAESFEIEPHTAAILEATSLMAHKRRVHPVREWLNSLNWDGKPRVNTWIKDFCEGEAEEPYLSEVSRKFLLAMVKRVFEPGCQWDYVLVLEGKQGKYKSSIARALASDKWFMDNLPDLKDKDAMLNLQGKWLIELGELTNVKRSDYNLVKAYLVRRTDTVRPHYGRIQADVPRQSVFIGTVNEGQYLKDPTGNRRYWPVKVGHCDVAGLIDVRDQLFAEAMSIYRTSGEILMLDSKATEQASDAQDDRRVEDDESEMRDLLEQFMESEESKEFDFERFKARDLFEGVSAPWGRFSDKNYALQTAAIVLTGMGFERHKIRGQRLWKKVGQTSKNGSAPLCPTLPPDEFNFL